MNHSLTRCCHHVSAALHAKTQTHWISGKRLRCSVGSWKGCLDSHFEFLSCIGNWDLDAHLVTVFEFALLGWAFKGTESKWILGHTGEAGFGWTALQTRFSP